MPNPPMRDTALRWTLCEPFAATSPVNFECRCSERTVRYPMMNATANENRLNRSKRDPLLLVWRGGEAAERCFYVPCQMLCYAARHPCNFKLCPPHLGEIRHKVMLV